MVFPYNLLLKSWQSSLKLHAFVCFDPNCGTQPVFHQNLLLTDSLDQANQPHCVCWHSGKCRELVQALRHQPPTAPCSFMAQALQFQSSTWQNKDAEAARILLFIICSSSARRLFICSFIKCGMLFQSWNVWFQMVDFLPAGFPGNSSICYRPWADLLRNSQKS